MCTKQLRARSNILSFNSMYKQVLARAVCDTDKTATNINNLK